MSTQKAKFELFSRLQALGFTYDEAAALRRIEMTLQRWAEAACGDSNGRCIERDETTGKPFMTYDTGQGGKRGRYPVADREAGALRRLDKIVTERNARMTAAGHGATQDVVAYHQGDCRGCMLYIVRKSDLADGAKLDQAYTRGLAVCA